MVYILVGAAGFLGAALRYSMGVFLFQESAVFPFATLTVNLLGSFLLAWLTTGLMVRFSLPAHIKTALGTGFVGSFTTFSTLSVETAALFLDGKTALAVLYIAASIFGGLWMSRLGFQVRKGEDAG
ncbi:chromosome condensation protein CrcB [Cytobacillus firmus]|uniref:CrcB family protein n=1 Tax=Cytobacillus firmus TaxID=1399 RepID=UPI0018CDC922|nr:CrcB family protein [Cytobacillus firmus]MBG9444507.1 chromosome condensation protein CrcB [Cytobacillus firmus]MBG9452324.1 chromosome condensation protein CrcB [Cytobacillus firmus]URT70389.1 CrcB family protein [Cytobacillus firmus]WHY61302.1 CrcB family protein [Cytobacillus firmus]